MKVEFIQDFEAQTTSGARTITVGTVLDLSPEKARRLIQAEVAVEIDEEAWPRLQGETLVIPCKARVKYRWWQGGQSVEETLKELLEERAAIMQLDGRLSREETEAEAARIMARYVPNYPYLRGGENNGGT